MRLSKLFLRMCALGCGLLAAACMTSPRDGLAIASTTSVVPFDGMALDPGAVVRIAVYNNANARWDDITTITAETAATVDAVGTKWYKWGRQNIKIPDKQYYWARDDRGINKAYAQVKAYDGLRGSYFSFTPDADACLKANEKGGGLQMGVNCKSSHSPSAMISAPCGTEGLASCDGWCNAGLVRDSANRCRRCGGRDQSCCNSSTIGATGECGANLTCQRSDYTCRAGYVYNPPGSVVQGCTVTGCDGPGGFDGVSQGCYFERTKTKCYGVVLACNDVQQCGIDYTSLEPIRKESGWYVCGACIGLPF